MTITQTLYVLETASCRNMSRAAQRLYVSQSAISQQIARLEEELGYPLFTRTASGLELTQAGESFCRDARPVIDGWQKLCRDYQGGTPKTRRHLRIGVGSRVYSNGLFRELMRFFEERQDVELSLISEAGVDFLKLLRQQSVDLVLDRLPAEDYLLRQTEYMAVPLITERQCVLLPPDDPRAQLKGFRFEELENASMITGLENSAEARWLRDLCLEKGIHLQRVYRIDGIDIGMKMVQSGVGIALGPESFAEYFRLAAVPLVPERRASLQFICPRALLQRREIRELRECLTELCRGKGL